MEDRRDHRIRGLVAGLAAAVMVLSGAPPAVADNHSSFDWPLTATVSSKPDAVVVQAEVRSSKGGGSGGRSSGSGSRCHLEPTNMGPRLSRDFLSRPGDELPYFLWCDGRMMGLVWRGSGGGGERPAGPSPREVALRMRDRIPIPAATIGVNPERGLVGVESWFWIEGYDGHPIVESADSFGRRIEVEARVRRYEWSFGDGAVVRTQSPGRAYPERSEVRHTYERSSLGHDRGYTARVGFVFSVRYRVDGGGWIDLPGIERVAEAVYPVRESQAVIRR